MKNKSYLMLLLTTTILVGCGGDGGSASKNTENPSTPNQSATEGTKTQGAPNQPTAEDAGGSYKANTNSTDSEISALINGAHFGYLVNKVNGIDELLAQPEFATTLDSLKVDLNRLNHIQKIDDIKPKAGETLLDAKLAYVRRYDETVLKKIFEIVTALQLIVLRDFEKKLTLRLPDSQASWVEMSEYVQLKNKTEEEIKKAYGATKDLDELWLIEKLELPEKFPLKPEDLIVMDTENKGLTTEEQNLNSVIKGLEDKYVSSPVPEKYKGFFYEYSFGQKVGEYIKAKFDQNPTAYQKFTTKVQDELGLISFIVKPSDSQRQELVLAAASDGIFKRRISEFTLLSGYLEELMSQEVRNETNFFIAKKAVISIMIKSGQFKGLFDYLRGQTDTVDDKPVVGFTQAEYDTLVAEAAPQALAADISPSTIGRSARQGLTGVDASQLQINGASAGKIEMALPISINLKGKIDGAKSTAMTSGSAAYKLGNTVFGVVHAYANKGEGFESNSHQFETSVAISQSIGNVFIEGQAGYVGTQQFHTVDMSGNRYQLSIGFDTQYVSPFLQVAYRDFGTISDKAAYIGAEVSIERLKADIYNLDMSLNAKVGRDSKSEFTGSLEWTASLNLNSGVMFKTDMTLGTNEGSTFGLTANLNR